jgi:uncharacterized iron-regulated membrane protein
MRRRLRRWSDVLHRWLGFSAGVLLVVIGLSGSLLSFYMEIERSWYPHMRTLHPHAPPSSYEAIYQTLAHLPVAPPGGSWKIEIPPDGGVITSRYSVTGAPTRLVTLDPVTRTVLRDAHWNDTFFTWIYDVHEYLQLGSGARPWIGYVALVMVVMVLGGIASWLLPPGGLRAKVSFKRHTTPSRRIYDIHKLGGASTAVFLTLTVGTGALISMPDQFRALLHAFSPLKPTEPTAESRPAHAARRLTVDEVLAQGPAYFPGSRVVWVRVPSAPSDTYDLQIRQAGAPMNRFPRTHLYIDQYNGQILTVYDPKSDGWGDTVLNWLVPIHDGKAFGLVGRIVVMGLGLVPAVMFCTGFMRWRHDRTVHRATRRIRERSRDGTRMPPLKQRPALPRQGQTPRPS